MAKNKGTHGRGKVDPELTEPDEFVQTVHSFGDIVQPHLKKIIAGGVVIAGAIVVWQVMGWQRANAAKRATSAYLSVVAVANRPVVGQGDKDSKTAVSVEPFDSEEARVTGSVQALDKFLDEYDDSDVGVASLALPKKAALLLKAGRFDEARAVFAQIVDSKLIEPIRFSALEGIGFSLEGKAMSNDDPAVRQEGLAAALDAFARLQPNEGEARRDFALYHQGRILIAMGKKAEGIEHFKKVLAELPDSTLTGDIKGRLDMLEENE